MKALMQLSKTERIIVIIILLCLTVGACKSKNKFPYCIGDFNSDLQTVLTKIVDTGIVTSDDNTSYLENHASIKTLEKLSFCEHPILRSIALEMLLTRENVDKPDIIFGHLDDTAWVYVDNGEFGNRMERVADHMLYMTKFDSKEQRQEVIGHVLKEHNNLTAAYYRIHLEKPNPKYYPIIKKMILRKGRDFAEIEYALYALAKYQNVDDIVFIKSTLIDNISELGYTSLEILGDYPNEAYVDVLKEFATQKIKYDLQFEHGALTYELIDACKSYKSKRIVDVLHLIKEKACRIDSAKYIDSFEKQIDAALKVINGLLPEKLSGNRYFHESHFCCNWFR